MCALELKDSPCGHLVPTVGGQMAFVPDPLPQVIQLSPSLVYRLDRASRAVATLAGVGETLPNPHLLIRPFVSREAVLSSRIEGTQASISDVFMYEASGARRGRGDTREVVNYIRALEHGLSRLTDLPVCVRLANEMHAVLLEGVRGKEKKPGELRQDQVWIGSEGTEIGDARFIPPPASLAPDLLADWERFLNTDLEMPPLVRCALMHYQFEAIHPYLDGNGRIGRLLIILFLCAEGVLPAPLLYLSAYFERNRDEYNGRLYQVSLTGQWESWLGFFLDGVWEQAHDAVLRSRRVRQLQEQYRDRLQQTRASGNTLRLLDELFASPIMTAPQVAQILKVTPAGARLVLERLKEAEIVEVLPETWPRFYVARELLAAIEAPVAKMVD